VVNLNAGAAAGYFLPRDRIRHAMQLITPDSLWRASAAVTVLTGSIVLITWLAGSEWPAAVLPSAGRMRANTALCFILLGLALAALGPELVSRRRTMLGLGGAAMVGAVGVGTLVEWITRANFGLDQMLIVPERAAAEAAFLARMAPINAVAMILGAAGIAMLPHRQHRYSQLASVAMGLCAFLTLSSMVLGAQNAAGRAPEMATALSTSITMLVLSAGILAARPDALLGAILSNRAGGAAARLFIPLAATAPLVMGWLALRGVSLDLYTPERAHALLATAEILMLTVIGTVAARWVNRMDAEAHRQHAFFTAVVESASDAIHTRAADRTITTWNRASERLFGYTASEIIGQRPDVIVPLELRPEIDRLLDGADAGEFVDDYETVRVAKDGRRVPVSVSTFAVRDETGTRLGTGVLTRDLTDQRDVEHLNAARLRLLEFSAKHTVEQLLGRTLEEAESLSGSQISFLHFVEDDQEHLTLSTWSARTTSVFCRIERSGMHYPISEAGVWVDCVREGRPVVHNSYADLPHRRGLPPGHAEVVRELAVPVIRNNRIRAILGVGNKPSDYTEGDIELISALADLAWDIVERVQAANAVRESEERLRQLVENTNDFVFLVDLDHDRLLFASAAYERIWGRPLAAIYERTDAWMDALHPDDRDGVRAAIAAGPSVELEFRIVHPDRAVRWIHYTGHPVTDPSGHAYRLVGVAEDVTERKSIEEQHEAAQRLEAVGQLAAGIAHDFNNKLAIIMGTADLAVTGLPASAPVRSDFEVIRTAAERAADMTRQLLGFAGKQPIAPIVQDLNETLGTTPHLLGRLIPERISLVWRPDTRACRIRMDPGQIDQLLMNLVVNARDAIPGNGTITITTRHVELDAAGVAHRSGVAPGPFVILEVGDDGVGMDAATAARAFEPFFSTKGPGRGTGLGLATVQGIAHQNAGFVDIRSAPGVGTAVGVHLPCVGGARAGDEDAPAPAVPETRTETVLLVEDEAVLLAVTRRMLEQMGLDVLACDNPREALRVATDYAGMIDLLVTDVVMPEMSGPQLLRSVHRVRPALRCVFVSGYPADALADSGVGTDIDLVQKPFAEGALTRKVREVLDRR